MKIKMNYMLPLESAIFFDHVHGKLTITVDTETVEDERDFKARIVDEVLREYGICLTRFDEKLIPRWSDIIHTFRMEINRRRLDDALSELETLKGLRSEIDRRIPSAEKKAAEAVSSWRKEIGKIG